MEPDKKIEQLLRAYARRRRSRMPHQVGMPSSMLARLRQELGAQFHASPSRLGQSWFTWLESHWFRFVAGAAGVAALLVLWLFQSQPYPLQVSQADKIRLNKQETTVITNHSFVLPATPVSQRVSLEIAANNVSTSNSRISSVSGESSSSSFKTDTTLPAVRRAGRMETTPAEMSAQRESLASSRVTGDRVAGGAGSTENGPIQVAKRLDVASASRIKSYGKFPVESNTGLPSQAVAQPVEAERWVWRNPVELQGQVNSSSALASDSLSQSFQNQVAAGPGAAFISASDQGGQLDRRKRPVPAAVSRPDLNSQVLNTFNFRLDGSVIRMVDADGSIYSGQIAPALEESREKKVAEPQTFRAPLTSSPPVFFQSSEKVTSQNATNGIVFEALGTNLSLNQKVMVQGRILSEELVAADSPTRQVEDNKAKSLDSMQISNARRSQQNFIRIQGQAQVGTNRIPINAIPAKP